MAQLFLNIIEDLPVGNTGMDQQLLNIDSWASLDGYVETPSDVLESPSSKFLEILEQGLRFGVLLDDVTDVDQIREVINEGTLELLTTKNIVYDVNVQDIVTYDYTKNTMYDLTIQDLLGQGFLKDTYYSITIQEALDKGSLLDLYINMFFNGTKVDEVGFIDDLPAIDINITKENESNSTGKNEAIDINVSVIDSKGSEKELTENVITMSDSMTQSILKVLQGEFGFASLTFDEVIPLVDSWVNWDNITDSEEKGEALEFYVDKFLSESWNSSESISKSPIKRLVDTFKTVDSMSKSMQLAIDIAMTLGEFPENLEDGEFSHIEALSFVIALQMRIEKNISEDSLSILDTFGRGLFRELFEEFLVQELSISNSSLKLLAEETLQIIDTFSKPLDGYISGMSLFNEGMGQDDFRDVVLFGSPAGYKSYVQYLQGDYEFEKARIKALVRTDEDDTSGVEISNILVEVDIPDTNERSVEPTTVTVVESNTTTIVGPDTVEGKFIPFTKRFYNPPEVVITVGNTTVLKIPLVTKRTNQGFFVKVVDKNDIAVEAEISWIAQGY